VIFNRFSRFFQLSIVQPLLLQWEDSLTRTWHITILLHVSGIRVEQASKSTVQLPARATKMELGEWFLHV